MAKGGINLNPGANPTLVAAATGSALKLPDYSKTFQAVADSYDKTMQAQADMWGNIMMAGAKIGKSIKEDIAIDPPEGTEHIMGDLEDIQEMFKQSYGLSKVNGKRLNPLGKEARELNKKAQKEKQRLIAEAEYELKHINAIETAHSSGMVDDIMTGFGNLERSHAVVATRRGKTTDHGNYFKWEDVDGERKMVMYHDPSKIKKDTEAIEGFPYHMINTGNIDEDGRLFNDNNEPIITDAEEILRNLHGDQINKKTGVGYQKTTKSTSAAAIQKMGFQSTVPFSELDTHSIAQIQDVVDGEKNNRVNWFTASFADPGNRSFYNRVTNADKKGGSVISSEMYTQVAKLSGLPTNEEGDLEKKVF